MPRHIRRTPVSLIGAAVFATALCNAQTYTISTAAGGANVYFYSGTGDGGPATAAGLANPCNDVATDQSGNVYIAAGPLIRKVSGGTISTWAGGGSALGNGVPATQAALYPLALAVDSSGNLFIADGAFGLYRIRKVDTKGIITTVAGGAQCCLLGDGGPAINAYLEIPYGLAVDTAGDIYIAQVNSQNNLVRKVGLNGIITTIAGGGPAPGDGVLAIGVSLARPTGVAVDPAGNLYIAEENANRIRKISTTGIISTAAGSGAGSDLGDGGPALQAGIDAPWHVTIDAANNIYITQINDARVRLVTASGSIATIFGTGGPATNPPLDRPAGIAVDTGGRVYISDATAGIARVWALTPVGGQPAITPNGVVPIYSTSTTIESGSWVSIYGNNLATGTSVWNGDFPGMLGGTTVTIDSKPAYLWLVSPTQINLQAPDDTNTGPVTVVVTTAAGSTSSTVSLGPYAPSFSLLNAKYPAAIVLTPGSPGNSGGGYDVIGPAGAFPYPTRPAKAGETVVLFGVGFGPTNPPVQAGKILAAAAPSAVLPRITIGGLPATVVYGGIVEAGLFQFNIVVPNAGSGDQQLQASIGGMSTPNTIAITLQ